MAEEQQKSLVTDERVHRTAQAFSLQTDAYEAVRPSYPLETVDFMLEAAGLKSAEKEITILDLAAGTGKFTRLLPSGGNYKLIAVEPAPGMRDKFKQVLPNVEIFDGISTKLPVASESIDLVSVAQGFHWFANLESLKEIHRVLKPGGSLGLIWNMEDDRSPWVAALRDLYERFEGDAPQYRHGSWKKVWEEQHSLPEGDPNKIFKDAIHKQFTNSAKSNTAEDMWLRVLSKSYITQLPEEEQQKLKQEIYEKVFKKFLPQLVEDSSATIDVPYTTDVFVYHKI
eukprot:TRINITY_DN5831_c0_g2_i1.p2 TRINITY_DN5831_c0_g2~~TRINITY_DN5831_c0_g2_i1.p2  ORF type:complete len:311 (+),score=110.79 TRINITY_DN5831_c0_g2_i1:82-933(+)